MSCNPSSSKAKNDNNDAVPTLTVSPDLDILVKTNDGETVPVKATLMTQSGIFRQMFQDLDLSNTKESIEFPVEIRSDVMKKVVKWMEMHVGVEDPVVMEEPLTRERKWFSLTEADCKFLSVEMLELTELVTAANFLDIKTLYLYGCQTIAGLIKDKSPEQVRKLLDLEDDLTPEEKEEIRRNNVWCNY